LCITPTRHFCSHQVLVWIVPPRRHIGSAKGWMCLCLWRTSRLINIRIPWSNKLSSVYGLSLTTVPYFSLGSAAYKPSKLQGVLQLERCALLPPDIPALTRFWFGLSHPEGISDPPKDGCVSVCGVRLSSLTSALNGRINCRLLMGCP